MNVETLTKTIATVDSVAAHADFILGLAKPCVSIKLKEDEPIKESGSRLCGHPFVPDNFEWPEHSDGEYRFLGQINCAEIIDRPDSLPESGLLAFFFAYDEDGELFWQDEGYVIAYYWSNFDSHKVFDSPDDDIPDGVPIELTGGIDVPRHIDLRSDWPFDEDALLEFTAQLDENEDYLLGHPTFRTLAYDRTPKGDWISLLTVDSIDEFDWCWHDGDKLMVFIERDKLANKDFSNLACDAG